MHVPGGSPEVGVCHGRALRETKADRSLWVMKHIFCGNQLKGQGMAVSLPSRFSYAIRESEYVQTAPSKQVLFAG